MKAEEARKKTDKAKLDANNLIKDIYKACELGKDSLTTGKLSEFESKRLNELGYKVEPIAGGGNIIKW
jgi:hypothetical protein